MTTPLGGLIVADFSRVLSGPLATMLLADLGADVIKVERPATGDDTRAWGPPFVDGESAYFLGVNRNKRSVVLDLATADGHATALKLVSRADVVVENFRPGAMDRLGLGYAALSEARPELVYCSISGFGSGIGRDLPGYDFIVQAAGGLMSITGPADGEPHKVGVALVDVLTGLHAVVGIMAALRVRDQTGHGQLVEVNLVSSLLASLVNQASSYVSAGVVPTALGNRHPSIVPYETVATSDRRIALAVGNDRQFRALCEVLARPDLAQDERFSTNSARVENRDALLAQIEAMLRAKPATYWIPRLDAASVPAGPINNIAEAFALAEELGLDPVCTLARGDDAPLIRQPSNPIRLSETPVAYHSSPPRLGEHTQEVLDWLSTVSSNSDPAPQQAAFDSVRSA